MPGRFKKTDLSYDKAGRPKTEQTYQNGTLAMTLTTSYGLDGQPTTVGDGSDSLTSVYDPYGRLDQTKRGSTVLTDYAYNPDGTIASRVDGSLAATSFGYDWAKRPISTTLSPTIYAGSPLTATFRLDGLVDKVTLPSGPQSSTLGYDAARRPISLTLQSGGSLSQAYDRAGNRLTKIEGSTTFTYQYRRTGGISHVQETGQGSQFFVHDAYGNLTADSQSGVSTTSYTYDARNELVAITPPSGPVATFTRDALGRLKERTLSTSPTATTDTYGYVGTSEAVFEIVTSGGSSSTTRGAIGVDGTRLAVRTSTTSFTLADLHGSIAGLFAATPTSVADAYRIKDLGVSRTQIGVAPAGPPDHRRRGRSGGGHIRLRP